MRRIGVDERRARLAVRHHLAPSARAAGPVEVARDLVALHATDPASVFLALWARVAKPTAAAIEKALYEERSLVRMLGMRRTMFVVTTDLAPTIQAACTNDIAVVERRRLVQLLGKSGMGNADAWLRQVESSVLRKLEERGELSATELSALETRLRYKLDIPSMTRYGPPAAVTTLVLMRLAAHGRIVRGRPSGTWTSGQYRWSRMERWLPGGMPPREDDAARVELVRRWLGAFGPAPAADIKWWTGWTAAQVKRVLGEIRPVEVDMDGSTGLVLGDDLEPVRAPRPWVALLPALDPTPMGWTARDWYLGGHGAALFDRSGNVGPTVWSDGRIIGGWGQRRDGEVMFRLLEDAGREKVAAISAEAERLTTWLGKVRVTPRFRTPLERELSA
jgi:hypothetical protein